MTLFFPTRFSLTAHFRSLVCLILCLRACRQPEDRDGALFNALSPAPRTACWEAHSNYLRETEERTCNGSILTAQQTSSVLDCPPCCGHEQAQSSYASSVSLRHPPTPLPGRVLGKVQDAQLN